MNRQSLRITSLHARISILFVILVLLVQGAGFVVIRSVIETSAQKTVDEQLTLTERVFQKVLRANRDKLTQAATITAADFGFRRAVASDNRATVESALSNQAERIKADMAMLVSLDGRLLAGSRDPIPNSGPESTASSISESNSESFPDPAPAAGPAAASDSGPGSSQDGQPFAFPQLIARAQAHGIASGLGMIDGQLYQLVAVPVKAPLAIGWVAMGFRIDDALAREMQGLTAADVSFLGRTGDEWHVLASSLEPSLSRDLGQRFSAPGAEETPGAGAVIELQGDDYTTHIVGLDTDGSAVVAVLQRSLREAMAPFLRLQKALLALTVAGLVFSVVASLVTARGVTRPIADLIRSTRAIGAGEYTGEIAVRSEDEIGELAQAFNLMRVGLAEREGRIMHLAYWDTLTGLPNRAQFNDRLTEAIQVAEGADVPLSLLMIDLDRFKYVNDTLGHHIGDLLLAEVGKRMAELVPANEATVARLGGDEFAILLPRQDIAAACRIAAKLLKRLEVPITVEGQVVDVSGSIGIVSFPDNGPDANTLFRHADLAMYAAKRGNLGFAVYEVSDVERHHAERLSLMTELRQAVEHDELMLYYQPKIDLVTGSVKYVEALVRWQHPSRGMVPPDAFIPFAEQTGYIKTISRWVVARAIEQCARWQEAGIELAVSINVSARDLIHSDLPEVLAQCLELNDVAPQKVWIEITESALMEDAENAIKTLDRLHAMGLRMSIDDFGTGYSSLAYLKRMPVDEIKIDKSFVLTMDTNAEDMTIVRSTIDLGHNMGLKVVAEGVETIEVLGQLREMGCDLAQGFYLSRPLPAAGLEAWLRNWDEVTGGQAQGAEEGLKAA